MVAIPALSVLSAGAIRRSVMKVAQDFERASGNSVAPDFAPAPKVWARVLAGESVDPLSLPKAA